MLGKIWHLQYLTPHLLPLMCLFRFVMPTNKVFFFFAGSNIFSSHSLAMRFLPPFHCCRHLQRVSFLDKKRKFFSALRLSQLRNSSLFLHPYESWQNKLEIVFLSLLFPLGSIYLSISYFNSAHLPHHSQGVGNFRTNVRYSGNVISLGNIKIRP